MRKQFQKEFAIISISFNNESLFLMFSKNSWGNAGEI